MSVHAYLLMSWTCSSSSSSSSSTSVHSSCSSQHNKLPGMLRRKSWKQKWFLFFLIEDLPGCSKHIIACLFYVGAPYLSPCAGARLSFQIRDCNSDLIKNPFWTACPANVLLLHAVVTRRPMSTNVGQWAARQRLTNGQKGTGWLIKFSR